MTAVEVPTAIPTPASRVDHLFRRLLRNPLAVVSMIVLAIVVLIAIIGPLIAPYDPNQASLQLILAQRLGRRVCKDWPSPTRLSSLPRPAAWSATHSN